MRELHNNGELKRIVDRSDSQETNPFLNENYSGYSRLATFSHLVEKFPHLWNTFRDVDSLDDINFAYNFINANYFEEDLNIGSRALPTSLEKK